MMLSDCEDRANLTWTMPDLKDAIIKGYYGEDGYISGIENLTFDPSTKGEGTEHSQLSDTVEKVTTPLSSWRGAG